MAHTIAQFQAHLLHIVVDIAHDFRTALRREHTEVDAAYAHVGRNANGAYRYEHSGHRLSLKQEDVAKFLLNETRYLLLAGCFHVLSY